MLTVDYDTLRLEPGDRLLDIGAGFGRHAFEAARRGATAIPCDLGHAELVGCCDVLAAMAAAGEIPEGATGAPVQGSALELPFPDATFDRIIASEVLEHIADDLAALDELHRVLRPGGTLAVTVPAWLPETLCWRLSSDYPAPAAVGGHVRIYSRTVLQARLIQCGFEPWTSHRAHGLHSPYWWLKCGVGLTRENHPLVRAYHRALVWDIVKQPVVTRMADRILSPVIGKSLVVYASRPGGSTAAEGTGRPARRRRANRRPEGADVAA
jgi:SAM-dependent methyltransferase